MLAQEDMAMLFVCPVTHHPRGAGECLAQRTTAEDPAILVFGGGDMWGDQSVSLCPAVLVKGVNWTTAGDYAWVCFIVLISEISLSICACDNLSKWDNFILIDTI